NNPMAETFRHLTGRNEFPEILNKIENYHTGQGNAYNAAKLGTDIAGIAVPLGYGAAKAYPLVKNLTKSVLSHFNPEAANASLLDFLSGGAKNSEQNIKNISQDIQGLSNSAKED